MFSTSPSLSLSPSLLSRCRELSSVFGRSVGRRIDRRRGVQFGRMIDAASVSQSVSREDEGACLLVFPTSAAAAISATHAPASASRLQRKLWTRTPPNERRRLRRAVAARAPSGDRCVRVRTAAAADKTATTGTFPARFWPHMHSKIFHVSAAHFWCQKDLACLRLLLLCVPACSSR